MLSAKRLSVFLGESPILQEISFDIKPGQITALLGNNGCGKTTIIKALSGLNIYSKQQWKQSGICELNGRIIENYCQKELALQRAVFTQQLERNIPFQVDEFVSMGRFPYQRKRKIFSQIFLSTGKKNTQLDSENDIVKLALSLTNTLFLSKRSILELSGGEFTRVRLAQAFAQIWPKFNSELQTSKYSVNETNRKGNCSNNRYLLLDEPTEALDLYHKHHLLATLRSLAKRWKLGILTTTHDINLAITYADNIIWLKKGKIVKLSTPTENISPETIERTFGYPTNVIKYKKKRTVVIPKAMIIN